jgi:hypothetical protein
MDAIFTSWPRLILEYVPFGSLEDLANLSVEDCVGDVGGKSLKLES